MRFTVSQSALSAALSVVSKGMATNSTLPIVSGVYIKADEGTLEFQTTDLVISIRHRIPAMVEEPGETVISGKMLIDIVKTLPDAAVSFEGGPNTVLIDCESSRFELNTLNPVDFPDFPSFALESSVELPRDILSDMVGRVYKVTSKDTSRPILGGILLTVEENLVRLVATDSYRLAVCDTNVETSTLQGEFKMIIPGAAFHDVLSVPSDSGTILVGSTESQVVFVFGNTTYISRRIEGNFPNYRSLLPQSCNTSVKVPLGGFQDSLRRVAVIARVNPSVRFDVDPDGSLLTLSATSSDQGYAREELTVEAEGQQMVCALNHRYVMDCINALSGADTVDLELVGPENPAIFKSYGAVNYLYLLMPVKL